MHDHLLRMPATKLSANSGVSYSQKVIDDPDICVRLRIGDLGVLLTPHESLKLLRWLLREQVTLERLADE